LSGRRPRLAVVSSVLLILWPIFLIVGLTVFSTVDADGDVTTANGPPVVRLMEMEATDVVEEATETPGSEARDHRDSPIRRVRDHIEALAPGWFGQILRIRGP